MRRVVLAALALAAGCAQATAAPADGVDSRFFPLVQEAAAYYRTAFLAQFCGVRSEQWKNAAVEAIDGMVKETIAQTRAEMQPANGMLWVGAALGSLAGLPDDATDEKCRMMARRDAGLARLDEFLARRAAPKPKEPEPFWWSR